MMAAMVESARSRRRGTTRRIATATAELALFLLLTLRIYYFGNVPTDPAWIGSILKVCAFVFLFMALWDFYELLFPPKPLAIAEYSRDDWQKLKGLAEDPRHLGETFEEWRARTDALISGARAREIPAEVIRVDVSALDRWCREHGRRNNARERARYAWELMRERESVGRD